MQPRFERFSLAICEIFRCWHRIAAEEMEAYGLKGTHAMYLTTLLRHPQGLTAAELGKLCGRDKSEVSRTVAFMEEKGILQKTGRSYRATLTLTPTGWEAAEHARRRADLAVEIAGAALTEDQRQIFYAALESITKNLQTISEAGLP